MSTPQQVESWALTIKGLGPRQMEVMEALLMVEPYGMSAWELSDKLGRMIHALRPRLTELWAMGRIYQSGSRLCRLTNRHEAVWRIAPQNNKQMEFL